MEEDNENNSIVLEIEGREVVCKKSVLVQNSDYFLAMFGGNFIESSSKKIILKDLAFKSFNYILKLLEDPGYRIRDCDLYMVLKAASMLQFNSIKLFCETRISESMNPLICLKIWKIAETLDLEPMWLKAKYMALREFDTIRNSTDILEFTLQDVCLYLGHVYLNTNSEMSVFEAAMNWWHENYEKFDKSEHTKILLNLINCLDINRLQQQDLKEIQHCGTIVGNETIHLLLGCVIDLKTGIENVYPEIVSKYAKHLCNSVERRIPQMPCILMRDLPNVCPPDFTRPTEQMFYDTKARRFHGGFLIEKHLVATYSGYHFISHKEFTFFYGGEHAIGQGPWNTNLWVYDGFKEKWEIKSEFPYPRRHFQSTFVGDNLFIIGGVGKFRVHEENMFWYNLKDNCWSPKVKLPSSARKVKCCSFQNQLLILYLTDKRAFFYNLETKNWRMIDIVIEKEIIDGMGEFAMFANSDNLYVKGKSLINFRLIEGALIPVEKKDMRAMLMPYDEIQAVLCQGTVYTLYKRYDYEYDEFYSFEILDLKTGHSHFVYKDSDDFKIDSKLYIPSATLFSADYFKTVKQNNLVNGSIL